MLAFSENQLHILFKLWRNRCFGKGHMLLDTLVDGFPTHAQDKITEELKELLRQGILGENLQNMVMLSISTNNIVSMLEGIEKEISLSLVTGASLNKIQLILIYLR